MQPDQHQSRTPPLRFSFETGLSLVVRAAVVVLVGVGVVFVSMPPMTTLGSPKTEPGPQERSADEQNPNLLSVVACATCHGSHEFLDSKNPDDLWRSSYQIWAAQDPHSDAYISLWNDQSKKIVSILTRASKDSYQEIINKQCISCHSTVPWEMSSENPANQAEFASILFLSNGVSCISCHSESALDTKLGGQEWIAAHAKKNWTNVGQTAKKAMGLLDLARLDVRAQACMKCHIGSQGRDVNHDLIAAGHPRLGFEYSSHLKRLPKHWAEKNTNRLNSTCWSVGQIEAARSLLSLLQQRVVAANNDGGVWPEFTEYNCHHCHHELYGNWYFRSENAGVARPSWGTWGFPRHFDDHLVGTGIDQLRIEMEKPNPDLSAVHSLAGIQPELQYKSTQEHLYHYIRSQPRLNSDELIAWYLAVNCCLEDSLLERDDRDVVFQRMLTLKTMLDQPFVNSTDSQKLDKETLLQAIEKIQEIVLPALEKNENFRSQHP